MSTGQKDGLRAEALRLGCRHGRAYSAGAGLIGAGADHPAAFGRAPHDDRQPDKLGAAGLLHRGVEGVHVDQQDGAGHRLSSCPAQAALSSREKSSLVDTNRHSSHCGAPRITRKTHHGSRAARPHYCISAIVNDRPSGLSLAQAALEYRPRPANLVDRHRLVARRALRRTAATCAWYLRDASSICSTTVVGAAGF